MSDDNVITAYQIYDYVSVGIYPAPIDRGWMDAAHQLLRGSVVQARSRGTRYTYSRPFPLRFGAPSIPESWQNDAKRLA